MSSPVFVTGCDRSGTSLLTLMLDRSSSLKMLFEVGFVPHLASHESEYGDFSEAQQRWYFIRDLQRRESTSGAVAFDKIEGVFEEEAERILQEAAPIDYAGAVDALFSAVAEREEKPRWGEKMPEYVFHVEWLASAFPGSQIVHIIRDPRDVAASIRRAGWKPSIGDAAAFWKKRVSAARSGGHVIGGDRYHEVRYESLVQNPAETLQRLARRIDIQFESEMTSTHQSGMDAMPEAHQGLEHFSLLERPVDPSRAHAWKRELSRSEIADVERVAAPLMRNLGYDVTGKTVPLWVQGARWAKEAGGALVRRTRRRIRSVVP
ncbi:hypothetical protein GGQ18_002866 [Salinibacter ruber]|uniref:sulfotransferase family protein n=1 Tax=Salinibacter ruber TaxID=146919 RepID=UPI001619E9BF|nr:sulfotransferase [Salinibacter ruber]MBB4070258.1 hypothetical protein [Salinibacter ruber]